MHIMQKGMEAMRTREEQLNELAFLIDGVQATDATKRLLERNLIEAEVRGVSALKDPTQKTQAGERTDIRNWQENQKEWFDPTTCSIVAEYAAWRDQQDQAERRAEQQVRAEIGRDSERLEWLEQQPFAMLQRFDQGWTVATDQIERSCGQDTARNAIDAAREVV